MMKTLPRFIAIVAASAIWAHVNTALASPADAVLKGEVLEVKDVGSYTYLRLKTADGEAWAAIERTPVGRGSTVTIENVTVMDDFTSRSLNRTFKSIAFGNLASGGDAALPPHAAGDTNPHVADGKNPHVSGGANPHFSGGANPHAATPTDTADIRVDKAAGANAWTVAEVITKAADLADKPVLVRGRVVKVNTGIMGRNWVHLRDGSGSPANRTDDLLVTSTGEVKVGDVVTASGVVHTDRDFGSGYAFKVMIEEATFRQ